MKYHYHIDNLRAFLMTMGVVLHAGMVTDFWISDAVGFLSSLFRMKLFFLVSGFFIALSISKKGNSSEVLKNRLVRLGVPALVFILIFNPITNFLAYNLLVGKAGVADFFKIATGTMEGMPADMNWHLHIWFLLVLLCFCMAAPAFIAVCRTRPVIAAVDWVTKDDRSLLLRISVLAFAVSIACLAGRTLHYLTFQQVLQGTSFNFPVLALLWYPPFFVLGILAFQQPRIFELLHKSCWQLALIAGIFLGAVELNYAALEQMAGLKIAETLRHLATGLAGYMICTSLLALFSSLMDANNRHLQFLVRASYTVYLFHMLFLVVFYLALKNVLEPSPLVYLAAIVTSYSLCLAVHRYCVESNPIGALLFNGKPLRLKSRKQAVLSVASQQ